MQRITTTARYVEAGAVGDFEAQKEALHLFTCVSYKVPCHCRHAPTLFSISAIMTLHECETMGNLENPGKPSGNPQETLRKPSGNLRNPQESHNKPNETRNQDLETHRKPPYNADLRSVKAGGLRRAHAATLGLRRRNVFHSGFCKGPRTLHERAGRSPIFVFTQTGWSCTIFGCWEPWHPFLRSWDPPGPAVVRMTTKTFSSATTLPGDCNAGNLRLFGRFACGSTDAQNHCEIARESYRTNSKQLV